MSALAKRFSKKLKATFQQKLMPNYLLTRTKPSKEPKESSICMNNLVLIQTEFWLKSLQPGKVLKLAKLFWRIKLNAIWLWSSIKFKPLHVQRANCFWSHLSLVESWIGTKSNLERQNTLHMKILELFQLQKFTITSKSSILKQSLWEPHSETLDKLSNSADATDLQFLQNFCKSWKTVLMTSQ